jgi:8-amino-7-oxononanoate synthase
MRRDEAASLIETLRARNAPAARPAAAPQAARPFDFGSLPEAREIAMAKTAGQMMGVQDPFLLPFDDRPTAETTRHGRPMLNFSTYDYLGIGTDPRVEAAAMAAIERHGVSCGASRLVGGERPAHREFEQALAAFFGLEDAVCMVSGHATSVTTIGTLLGPEDLIILDELMHNSAYEGARLSGATRLSMPHNDLDWLETTLAARRAKHRRVLIVVEGLYSMDGDCPDLARLIELKGAYDAWLMVDEAHAVGVLGATGRGVAEAQGIDPRLVDIWMGTLSKTFASTGGYIAGSAALIAMLKWRAPGFVFSVGLPPVLVAAAHAALDILAAEPARVSKLASNGRYLRETLRGVGLNTGWSEGHAVCPVVLGDSVTTAAVAHLIETRGVCAPPILHPAVPERRARLRLFASSAHERSQIDAAATIIAEAVAEAPTITSRLFGGR